MSHTWPRVFDGIIDSEDPVTAYFSHQTLGLPDCVSPTSYDNVSPGCPSGCVDPVKIFSAYSPANATDDPIHALWYCALYPNITNNFRLGVLSETNSSFLTASHVDTSLAKAASVTSIIWTYLAAYCESLEGCKQQNPHVCQATTLSINGSMLNTDAIDSCVQSICAKHPGAANTDVAGIGVLTSYILQAGLTLLSALTLTILSWRLKKSDQTSSRTQRFYDALLATQVDFLKTQCFLSMVISIASLIVLKSQSPVDQLALRATSIVSIVPVTLNLYILASFNPTRSSWYLYILSQCTLVLGACVVTEPQMTPLAELAYVDDTYNKNNMINSEYPNACSNSSPIGICFPSRPGPRAVYLPILIMAVKIIYIVSIPMVLSLAIWQLFSISYISALLSFNCFNLLPKKALLHLHKIALLFFLALLALFFMAISQLFSAGAVNTNWNFGQIITITVWIPTVAGFINNCMDGVGNAHTKQLPPRYQTIPSAGRYDEYSSELEIGHYDNSQKFSDGQHGQQV